MPAGVYTRKIDSLHIAFFKRIKHKEDCWMWLGAKSTYGMFRKRTAHRISWELHHGPIPKGLNVLHICDIKLCVNPEHLYLGTHKDNHRDLVQRGPYSPPPHFYGEDHHNAKLNWKLVKKVRLLRKIGFSYSKILKVLPFKLDKSTLASVLKNETWKTKNSSCIT